MSVPFKFLCLILTLLLQIRGGTPIKCYYCNTRDNDGCDHIRYAEDNAYVRECEGACSITKGYWGYPGARNVMLWRSCGAVSLCTQATALCCNCDKDFCNHQNQCFRSRGHLLVPGIFVFSTQVFIIVLSIFSA